MTLDRALRIAMVSLSTISFATLAATGKVPLILLAAGGVALIGAAHQLWVDSPWLSRHLSAGLWNGLVILASLVTAADYLTGSRDLLQASLYVLVLLMANKVLTVTTPQDALHLFAVTFLQFLAAAVLTVDLWFGIAFVAYVVGTVWALVLYHLVTEARATPSSVPSPPASVPLPRRFIVATTVLAVVTLAITSSVFVLIPRTGFGFFQRPQQPTIRTAGFSEHVDLGALGAVKQDRTLVMRVQLPGESAPRPEPLYFRGAAYDLYTGESWANTLSTAHQLRSDDGLYDLMPRHRTRPHSVIRQDILIEALDTTVLFGLPVVEEIRGQFPALQTNAMSEIRLPYPLPARFQYTVISSPVTLGPEDRHADRAELPATLLRRFLQVPPLDGRVAELARTVTAGTTTTLEQVEAVRHHLLSHYRYTLDLDSRVSTTPLEDFLFTRKTGYCEHYATAMVILLRTVGIPARLVTGFLSGTWNEYGHYYAVRQQDAHAWVEVYVPRSGWVTFDPTPAVAPERINPWFLHVASVFDAIRLRWDRFIIHYSFRDQMRAAQDLKRHGQLLQEGLWTVFRRLADAPSALVSRLGQLATVALLGLLATWGLRWWMRRRREQQPLTPPCTASQLYARLLGTLESHGWRKHSGITPWEFLRQLTEQVGQVDSIAELTALYYRGRFGGEILSEPEVARAEALLSAIASDPGLAGSRQAPLAEPQHTR